MSIRASRLCFRSARPVSQYYVGSIRANLSFLDELTSLKSWVLELEKAFPKYER